MADRGDHSTPPSKGYVVTVGSFEYFHGPDGTLYRALADRPLDLDGYRQGAQFECMPRKDNHKAHLAVVTFMPEPQTPERGCSSKPA